MRKIVCWSNLRRKIKDTFWRIFVHLCAIQDSFCLSIKVIFSLAGCSFGSLSESTTMEDSMGIGSNRFIKQSIKNVEALSEAKPPLTFSGDKTHTIQIEMA
jgi:hypothetical protein